MDKFTDYYAVLGVDANASIGAIKAAFKKLALQYHPDVYKGADAQERMRLLLLAYQTLSDAEERKAYDARRSDHVSGVSTPQGYVYSEPFRSKKRSADVSPAARRDRQRHYAFPDLEAVANHPMFPGQEADAGTSGYAQAGGKEREPSVHLDLGESTYDLSPVEAGTLKEQGMLRGSAIEEAGGDRGTAHTASHNYLHYCHRCHHRWVTAAPASRIGGVQVTICPACKASDWGEYLLLRCMHCHAVFESEQIRYEVGSYNYGDGTLCPPYELFPLCPYCGASGWCPAENGRVDTLRAQAARRAALLRFVWISVVVAVMLVLGVVALTMFR